MIEQLKLVRDTAEIQREIARVATEITDVYGRRGGTSRNPLFVGLLNGAGKFSYALAEQIVIQSSGSFTPDLTHMRTSRTPDFMAANDITTIREDVPEDKKVDGRDIVVLDSVVDRGETYKTVREYLLRLGARSVALAVLMQKGDSDTANFAAFSGGTGYLVGFGMNDKFNDKNPESHRHDPYISRIIYPGQDDTPPQLALV